MLYAALTAELPDVGVISLNVNPSYVGEEEKEKREERKTKRMCACEQHVGKVRCRLTQGNEMSVFAR